MYHTVIQTNKLVTIHKFFLKKKRSYHNARQNINNFPIQNVLQYWFFCGNTRCITIQYSESFGARRYYGWKTIYAGSLVLYCETLYNLTGNDHIMRPFFSVWLFMEQRLIRMRLSYNMGEKGYGFCMRPSVHGSFTWHLRGAYLAWNLVVIWLIYALFLLFI